MKRIKPGPKKGVKLKGTNPYSFGQVIMKIRRKKGMTQKELAEKMGTSVRMVSYYERAMKNPEMETIEKLAAALDIDKGKILKPKLKNAKAPVPNRNLQKKLELVTKLPVKEQKYIAQTIDMLAERNGVK